MPKKHKPSQIELRILDANVNRLKEALRVIEDIVRFRDNHKFFAAALKALRHDVAKAVMTYPVSHRDLLASRNTLIDVGKRSKICDTKLSETNFNSLLVANFKRSQESCRVLEEISKMISLETSNQFQKIRFKLYDIEKKII